MNEMQPKDAFDKAGHRLSDEALKTHANIKLFLKSLSHFKTEGEINTPQAESYIRDKFESFLLGCGFHMAESDFEELLGEVRQNPREDNTVGWYHQLSPIVKILSLIEDGTISLEMFAPYGGPETVIRTALRHDSIEDFGKSFKAFEQTQRAKIEGLCQSLSNSQPAVFDELRRRAEHCNLDILMENLRLITKKVAVLDHNGLPQFHADGKMIKVWCDGIDNDVTYMYRMLEDEKANPAVWLIKICDGSNNLSSMLGAAKFTAKRRIEYANQRENMYGTRENLNDQAQEKWPEFAGAIRKLDHDMGMILYINFAFSKYVDLMKPKEFKEGDPVRKTGLQRYSDEALSLNAPRAFHSTYTLIDRIVKVHNGALKINSGYTAADIRRRTGALLKDCIAPSLDNHREKFPSLFKQNREFRASLPERTPVQP